jgi:uncharacterized membrane protein
MKNSVLFTLRVWLTAAVSILIITWITDLIKPALAEKGFTDEVIGRAVSVLLLSVGYAIPFFLSVLLVKSLGLNTVFSKLILIGITIFISWLPIVILKRVTEDLETISWGYAKEVFLYTILNCVWITVYKINIPIVNVDNSN